MRLSLRLLTGFVIAAALWLPTASAQAADTAFSTTFSNPVPSSTYASDLLANGGDNYSFFSLFSASHVTAGERVVNQVTATATIGESEGTPLPATPTTEISSDETATTATVQTTTATPSPTETTVETATPSATVTTAVETATRTTTSLVPTAVATNVPTTGAIAPTVARPTTLPNTGEPTDMLLWLVVAAVFSFIIGTSLLALQHRVATRIK